MYEIRSFTADELHKRFNVFKILAGAGAAMDMVTVLLTMVFNGPFLAVLILLAARVPLMYAQVCLSRQYWHNIESTPTTIRRRRKWRIMQYVYAALASGGFVYLLFANSAHLLLVVAILYYLVLAYGHERIAHDMRRTTS